MNRATSTARPVSYSGLRPASASLVGALDYRDPPPLWYCSGGIAAPEVFSLFPISPKGAQYVLPTAGPIADVGNVRAAWPSLSRSRAPHSRFVSEPS
jgi:hypothetical protein